MPLAFGSLDLRIAEREGVHCGRPLYVRTYENYEFVHRKMIRLKFEMYHRSQFTFGECRSDWIRDAIDIVSPGTSLAISALARLAIFPITIQVASCGTPTTILDSEEDLFP